MEDSERQVSLSNFEPGNEVYSVLDGFKTGQNRPARISMFIKNFGDELLQIMNLLNEESIILSLKKENTNLNLFELSLVKQNGEESLDCPYCKQKILLKKERGYSFKTYLIEYKTENILVLVSNYPRKKYESLIRSMNRLYPLIGRVFYRSNDLHQILQELEKRKLSVVGKYSVAKRLYGGKRTSVTYEEDTIEGVFNRAQNQDTWIDSIRVQIDIIGELSINRRGFINYQVPFNFKNFFEYFVSTVIVEIILKRRMKLENKSRETKNPETIHPISLEFDKNYFDDEKNFEKLFGKLEQEQDYNLAIISFSKKSAHLMVFDYSNGCGFDIYINSSNKLKIVPQTQVTANALDLLIIKINDIFEEK